MQFEYKLINMCVAYHGFTAAVAVAAVYAERARTSRIQKLTEKNIYYVFSMTVCRKNASNPSHDISHFLHFFSVLAQELLGVGDNGWRWRYDIRDDETCRTSIHIASRMNCRFVFFFIYALVLPCDVVWRRSTKFLFSLCMQKWTRDSIAHADGIVKLTSDKEHWLYTAAIIYQRIFLFFYLLSLLGKHWEMTASFYADGRKNENEKKTWKRKNNKWLCS